MKNLKVSFIALFAMVLGFCFSAFTAPSAKPAGSGWFTYNGSGSLNDPNNYTYSGTTDPCSGTARFCGFNGIQQSGNPSLPTMTSLTSASNQSSNFTKIVSGVVDFKP